MGTKGQTLANFLADYPIPSDWKLCKDLLDDEVFFIEILEPWAMYFDGMTQRSGVRVDTSSLSPLRSICYLIALRLLNYAGTMWLNIKL